MRSYIVETPKLAHNLELLRAKADGKVIWAVVKGNGYGLGTAKMARFLAERGIDHFAVTDVSEVRAIREAGLENVEILMMESTCNPIQVRELLELNAIPAVSSVEDAAELRAQAENRPAPARAHLKIDTGMGRYGFLPEQIETVLSLYRDPGNVSYCGIYTHFQDACCASITKGQFDLFQKTLRQIRDAGFDPGMVHCCNSSAFWLYPEMHCDAVRLGSSILGRVAFGADSGLQRVGYCEAEIEEVRMLPAGHTVGYGGCWKAKKDTPIGVLSVGYSNGFSVDRGYDVWRVKDCLRGIARYLKALIRGKALYVQIGGKSCRVLGHVGMVNMVVDLTGTNCKVGDKAIVDINPTVLKGMDVEFRGECR